MDVAWHIGLEGGGLGFGGRSGLPRRHAVPLEHAMQGRAGDAGVDELTHHGHRDGPPKAALAPLLTATHGESYYKLLETWTTQIFRNQSRMPLPVYRWYAVQTGRLGEERNLPAGVADKPCHDCGAIKGQYHSLLCDMERCPKCGGQEMSCDCHGKTSALFSPLYWLRWSLAKTRL